MSESVVVALSFLKLYTKDLFAIGQFKIKIRSLINDMVVRLLHMVTLRTTRFNIKLSAVLLRTVLAGLVPT
jgi:hypothetical protein